MIYIFLLDCDDRVVGANLGLNMETSKSETAAGMRPQECKLIIAALMTVLGAAEA